MVDEPPVARLASDGLRRANGLGRAVGKVVVGTNDIYDELAGIGNSERIGAEGPDFDQTKTFIA